MVSHLSARLKHSPFLQLAGFILNIPTKLLFLTLVGNYFAF